MAECSFSSSAWMLALLLGVLVYQSSSAQSCKLNEFDSDVKTMKRELTNCSEDCSSPNITDKKCRCLNLSTSQKGCSPHDFIKGLENLTSHPLDVFSRLARKIPNCCGNCSMLHLKCEAKISPRKFQHNLKLLSEWLHSAPTNPDQKS